MLCYRVAAELSNVQSQLSDALINEGYYPKPLRDQKAKLEEQLEQLGAELRKEKASGGINNIPVVNTALLNSTSTSVTATATYHTLHKTLNHNNNYNNNSYSSSSSSASNGNSSYSSTNNSYPRSNVPVNRSDSAVSYLSPVENIHVVTAAPTTEKKVSNSTDYIKYGSNFVDMSNDVSPPSSTVKRLVTNTWDEMPQFIAKQTNSVYTAPTSSSSSANAYNSYSNAITMGSNDNNYQGNNYGNTSSYKNGNNNANPYSASITVSGEDFNSGKLWDSSNYNNNNSNNNNYNRNNGNRYDESNPKCNCNPPKTSGLFTSTKETTNGLQFYSCNVCNFFKWVDENEAQQRKNSYTIAAVNSMGIKNHLVEIQSRFGHHGFRHGQKECVENALRGRDVFCLMPTGGGKSVVYQVGYVLLCN